MIADATRDDSLVPRDDIVRPKVLVVDDDRDILESMTMILSSSGYEIMTADSCETCHLALEGSLPAVIIMDLMLETVSDGLALCRELRIDPRYRDIPTIMVSSIQQHTGFPITDRDQLADAFITKPFEPAVLVETVLHCIRG